MLLCGPPLSILIGNQVGCNNVRSPDLDSVPRRLSCYYNGLLGHDTAVVNVKELHPPHMHANNS